MNFFHLSPEIGYDQVSTVPQSTNPTQLTLLYCCKGGIMLYNPLMTYPHFDVQIYVLYVGHTVNGRKRGNVWSEYKTSSSKLPSAVLLPKCPHPHHSSPVTHQDYQHCGHHFTILFTLKLQTHYTSFPTNMHDIKVNTPW